MSGFREQEGAALHNAVICPLGSEKKWQSPVLECGKQGWIYLDT